GCPLGAQGRRIGTDAHERLVQRPPLADDRRREIAPCCTTFHHRILANEHLTPYLAGGLPESRRSVPTRARSPATVAGPRSSLGGRRGRARAHGLCPLVVPARDVPVDDLRPRRLRTSPLEAEPRALAGGDDNRVEHLRRPPLAGPHALRPSLSDRGD